MEVGDGKARGGDVEELSRMWIGGGNTSEKLELHQRQWRSCGEYVKNKAPGLKMVAKKAHQKKAIRLELSNTRCQE